MENIAGIANVPQLSGSLAAIEQEAANAADHVFDVLGSGPVSLGLSIDWHTDFKSGYRWPSAFFLDVQVTRFDDASDAKVPWELSRGHNLLALSRAAVALGDDHFARQFEEDLISWLESNPAGFGINWVNAMETAIRAVNWVWAASTLANAGKLSPRTESRLVPALRTHLRHIWHTLEGSPLLRGNHYVADLLGILTITAALGGDRLARWLNRYARQALEREIRSQVLEDGTSFEGSTAYHGLVLEMFCLASWIAAHTGPPLSTGYASRLQAMADASRVLRHPDGRVPGFGDNDSGRILPLTSARTLTHDHVLWLAAGALGSNAPLDGDPHPDLAWTFGLEAWIGAQGRPSSPPPATKLPCGGIYVLAGGGTRCVVRCGDVGQAGNGGHGHDDILSFELVRSRRVIADTGTYVYTADPEARNFARSAAAHNVLMVNNAEPNPFDRTQLFSMPQTAARWVERFDRSHDRITFVGAHDGYARFAGVGVHRRKMVLDPRTGALTIVDTVAGESHVRADLRFHLDPSVAATVQSMDVILSENLCVRFKAPTGWHVALALEQSWIADEYGRRRCTQVIRIALEGALPLHFTSLFGPLTKRDGGEPHPGTTPLLMQTAWDAPTAHESSSPE